MKKTQTESNFVRLFFSSLEGGIQGACEHYNHKSDAIKASYLLRDALVPVRERESYRHPVLGENAFDFERKVEKTENLSQKHCREK